MVYNKLNIVGYIIKLDALNEIISFASGFPGSEGEAVDLVLASLNHKSCTTTFPFFFHTAIVTFSQQFTSFFLMDNFFVFVSMAVQSLILDSDVVHRVVSILASDEVGKESLDTITSTSALCIIDAFDISKFRYNPIKKIFHLYVFPPCIFI